MTTAVAKVRVRTASGPGGRAPGRWCSVVAFMSVAAHLSMAWAHRAMPWESALMVLMAAACLPCAVAVWRHAHDKAVQLLMVMALLMVAVHAAVLLGPGALAGRQHSAMGSMVMASPGTGSAAMLGIMGTELGVAMMAAWVVRRSRMQGAAMASCAMGSPAGSSGDFTPPGA